MTIRVDTVEPFEGIIHGPNRSETGYFTYGKGGKKTYLRIDLTKSKGEYGGCGVRYNEVSLNFLYCCKCDLKIDATVVAIITSCKLQVSS